LSRDAVVRTSQRKADRTFFHYDGVARLGKILLQRAREGGSFHNLIVTLLTARMATQTRRSNERKTKMGFGIARKLGGFSGPAKVVLFRIRHASYSRPMLSAGS